MSDRKKDKPQKLNISDIRELKRLTRDADGDQFSLEEILAEYEAPPGGSGIPVSPRRKKGGDNVVAFPGTQPLPRLELEGEEPREKAGPRPGPGAPEPAGPAEPAGRDEGTGDPPLSGKKPQRPISQAPAEAPAPEEETEPEEPSGESVVPFPKRRGPLSNLLRGLGRKGDKYADRMFEEDERTDPEEVRRLEELIPGTDQEEFPEEGEESGDRLSRRRPPRPDPLPPDTDPRELAREYGRGVKGLGLRTVLMFLLAAAALGQLLVPVFGLTWSAPLDSGRVQSGIAAGLLAAGALLSADALVTGLTRALRGRLGMDTLSALACLWTLADGVALALQPEEPGRLPYSVVVLAGLWLLLRGNYHKRCALRLSCRTAAASSTPYRVTLEEGKWNGRDTYVKWTGTDEDFGSQIQADDGAQLIYRRFCPLLLIACVLLAPLAVWSRPADLLWALSALFAASAAFGGALAYGRSFHKVARRLIGSGAALAGWPGIVNSRRGGRVLLTDTDLFPPGYVALNGYKVLGDFPQERVVAYTATMIRASGSYLSKMFHDQLRALGGLMRNAEQLTCYEGGGLSAIIRGDRVLVGSAAFMNLMEVDLPQGLNVKSAAFCAINGELAGIFALSYSLPDTVLPSLEELMRERVGPVLATRDFNLIPAMLQQRFKLAADKMDFPPVERRRELSDPDQEHWGGLVALLCREGLFPFAEAVTAARRLRRATRIGAWLCCAGSAIGVVLSAYLVSAAAYGSLSPLNLLFYMGAWCLPVWLLSSWVHRF